MAVTLESSSSTTFATATTTVVTKPTGLAVGDLMIAQYTYNNPAAVHTLPSGWTSIRNAQTNNTYQNVAYKIADSTDVAATNFTFTTSSSLKQAAGIVRISGFTQGQPITQSNFEENDLSATNPVFATTITPFADSMLLMLIATSASGATYTSPSAYSVVTSNPTWTEIWDFANNTGNNMGMAAAYGVRTASTATGNASVTASYTGGGSYGWSCVLIGIGPSKDISVVESSTASDSMLMNLSVLINDSSVTSESITTDNSTFWSTLDKSNTTWVNIDKA